MLLDKVRDTINRYNLIRPGDKIIVGVSGGPDSVALLYLLDKLRPELKLILHIAHLDHMLRKDSSKDREFVERLARRLKLPITTSQLDIQMLSRRGSIEEIARNARLGFLFQVAKKNKSGKIALGHNLDDQAETVLMRLIRGSGLYGLSGISPKRGIAGYEVIRPLIEIPRCQIDSFLKGRKISPRIDISNHTDIYFRNRIRRSLLPCLEREYNSNIKELLANTAQTIGSDYDYLLRAANRILKQMGSDLKLSRLLKLHPAMLRLVLRLAVARVQGDMRRITFQHIREIEDLILRRPAKSIVDLPQNISVIKRGKALHFYRRKI